METLKPIFERAKRGDLKAYEQIVKGFQDLAVGYGFALLRDFHLAQDAAQEAFTEAWLNLERVYDVFAFPALLRKIVFKYCDRMTRRGKKVEIVSMEQLVEIASEDRQPDRTTEENEMRRLVREAINTLPENERQAVSLFYVSDYSQREVAAFLGVSVAVVKNRLRSARKRLKEGLFDMVKDNMHENRPSRDDRFIDRVREILAPDKSDHSEGIYELLDRRWSAISRQCRAGRIAHSHYDWQTSRIGTMDGDVVTHAGIYDLSMRIGSATVRTGGINLPTVHPDYRDEGIYAATIQAALDAMYAHGYDMSCTRTEPLDRFADFGYVLAWPDQETYFIDTEHLPEAAPEIEHEEVHVNVIHGRRDLAELHNRWHDGLTGTTVRPTYRRGKCPPEDDDPWTAYIFNDKTGRAVGYLYDGPNKRKDHEGRDLRHTDSAGDPEQILRVLGQLARQYQGPRVEFVRLPWHSALARRVRQSPHLYQVSNHNGRTGNQIRIINLETTLSKIASELSRRLRKSHLRDFMGTLRISIPDQSAMLSIDNGEVSVQPGGKADNAIESGHEFAQIIIGKEAPIEIADQSDMLLTGDAAELLDALFPAQHPQMPNEDL
ncbi:MAG: GNAT family N-acetyltransferase [Gemmatimonadota bacterium]|nr:GNAT family N-acetyltransferase [Gemmatimonadota bacterium]